MDRFRRHQGVVNVRKETERSLRETIGFKLTDDGHADVENKNIRNVGRADAANDMQDHHSKTIDMKDVDKVYLDEKCLNIRMINETVASSMHEITG